MALRRHLVVFARELRLGRGKRRLASRIGAVAAIHFQRVALGGLLLRLGRDPRWTTWVAVTPDRGRLFLPHSGVKLLAQGGGDLGKRMRRPMRRPPVGLPPGPVVVIGSDIPDIRRHHIWQAFRVLDRHQFVFGPARDGGYWLVGARRRPAEPSDIFQEVRWSTEHALADTLANLGPHQAGPPLPVLEDIDDSESWRRWRRNPFNRLHVKLKAARFGPALTRDSHRPYSPP
jgi:rSAM/selenodomain-associated transferase 1